MWLFVTYPAGTADHLLPWSVQEIFSAGTLTKTRVAAVGIRVIWVIFETWKEWLVHKSRRIPLHKNGKRKASHNKLPALPWRLFSSSCSERIRRVDCFFTWFVSIRFKQKHCWTLSQYTLHGLNLSWWVQELCPSCVNTCVVKTKQYWRCLMFVKPRHLQGRTSSNSPPLDSTSLQRKLLRWQWKCIEHPRRWLRTRVPSVEIMGG